MVNTHVHKSLSVQDLLSRHMILGFLVSVNALTSWFESKICKLENQSLQYYIYIYIYATEPLDDINYILKHAIILLLIILYE